MKPLVMVVIIVACMMINPFYLHYSVNFWLHYSHKPEAFGWGWSMLGLLLGPVPFALAIITKIASFFL